MQARIIAVLSVLALVVVGCSGSGAVTAPPVPADPSPSAPPAAAALSLVKGELGEYLADAEGNTLYAFLKDAQSGTSACYDECAATWPPLTTAVSAGAGVDAALLGTTTRTDGSSQVTYDGWPLYYFAADEASGDTKGQGVKDVWYVVDTAGDPIGAPQ